MSTRSVIAIRRSKTKYECIYCHSDGYLSYNGAMLLDHYSNKEKLEKLIKLGDISCLNIKVDPDPSKKHSFEYDSRQEDVVVAYGRDRGEDNCESKILSKKKMLDWLMIEYWYVYDLDGKWKVSEYGDKKFKDLKTEVEKEYKKFGIKRPKDYYGYLTDEIVKQIKHEQYAASM